MTCYHPVNAWLHKTKLNPKTGKKILVFSPPPDLGDYTQISVACGRCIGCRLDYSKNWAMRCYHESKLYKDNVFLTLTYDDDHVPWSDQTGEQTLVLRDLQLFWKNLRKDGVKLRYFACGEYGDLTYRPHYHSIVFGFKPADLELTGCSKLGFNYYKSNYLDSVWKLGHVLVADVSFDTCAYVARYVTKKVYGEHADQYYQGIKKEFCVMSRRPGIGHDYYLKYGKDWYAYDQLSICDNGHVRRLKPCKYYDTLFDLDNHDQMEVIKERRLNASLSKLAENCVSGRMDQREEFKKDQTKSLKRSKTDVDFCGL